MINCDRSITLSGYKILLRPKAIIFSFLYFFATLHRTFSFYRKNNLRQQRDKLLSISVFFLSVVKKVVMCANCFLLLLGVSVDKL